MMKHKISLLVLILLIPGSLAQLEILRMDMNRFGGGYVDFSNDGEPIAVDDIEIAIKYNDVKEDEVMVNGYWDKEVITDEASYTIPNELVIRSGMYTLCVRSGSMEITKNFIAPGVEFSCDYVDLEIEDCYTRNGYFTVWFIGKGLKQASNLDLYQELDVSIYGEHTRWLVMPDDARITYLGEDMYEMRFNPGENIDEITIRARPCTISERPEAKSYSKCNTVTTTTTTTSTTTSTTRITTTTTTTTTTSTTTTTTLFISQNILSTESGMKISTIISIFIILIVAVIIGLKKWK